MSSTFVRRAMQSALLGGILAGSLLSTTLPAHADEPAGTVAVAAAGSDTTEKFMNDYLSGKTSSNDGTTTYTVHTYNIPAFPTAAGFPVQNDGKCNAVGSNTQFPGGTMAWKQTPATPTAPSGSGAGRTRLNLERTVEAGNPHACIDIGRSSSKGGAGAAEGTFEYYGFALDAVTWATPSLKAPANLTRQQVQDIYRCNIKDWGDLPGGIPGPIQRYLPQSGSGTRNTFESEFLDVSAGNPLPNDGSNGCPVIKVLDKNGNPFEENQGTTIANADIDKAILPYSGGVWAYQKNNAINPSLDRRNNVRLGGTTTVTGAITRNAARWNGTNGVYELDFINASNPNGVVDDGNTSIANASFSKVNGFPGVRFLYNVVDAGNANSYGPAVGLVGFDNQAVPTFRSPVCNNAARTLILSYGFAPLTTETGASNLGATTCRKFAGTA